MKTHHNTKLFLKHNMVIALLGLLGLPIQTALAINVTSSLPTTIQYPNGSGSQGDYQFFNGGKSVQSITTSNANMVNIYQNIQPEGNAQLPEGFKLKTNADSTTVTAVGLTGGTDFGLSTTAITNNTVALYPIEYQGIPLAKGTDYLGIVGVDGKLLASRLRNLPLSVNSTTPTVAANDATQIAIDSFQKMLNSSGVFVNTEASVPSLEIWVDKQRQGYLSWKLTVTSKPNTTSSASEPVTFQYWIAATGVPTVLSGETLIFNGYTVKATGTVWSTTPFRTTASLPLGGLSVSASGIGYQPTNLGGSVYFPASGYRSFSSGLKNPLNSFAVINDMASPTVMSSSLSSSSSIIGLKYLAVGEFQLAQNSAFYWANIARDMAKYVIGNSLNALPINVNINNSCNAYWNGTSLNFFRAGDLGGKYCPNTAYSDVVLHEYGHGIDAKLGGILDGAYSEGFGDAMAILGTNQYCTGRDLLGGGTCLRDARTIITWPQAQNAEIHEAGRIYAGFVWDLTQRVGYTKAKTLVITAAAANPSNIPDAVKLSFIVDDHDGNLGTCSLNQKSLEKAADSRLIPRPTNCVGIPTSRT